MLTDVQTPFLGTPLIYFPLKAYAARSEGPWYRSPGAEEDIIIIIISSSIIIIIITIYY